jgi:hypothetical protein
LTTISRDRVTRQEPVTQRGVVALFGGRAGMADAAFSQDVDAVGEGQREIDPLLDQQDRDAVSFQRADFCKSSRSL